MADAAGRALTNFDGADAAGGGSGRLLRAHVANYLVALQLARETGVHGPLVDVGAGVGALSSWLAGHLDVPWHLVEPHDDVRQVARMAFPDATVHRTLGDVADGSAGLVTAMEVVEHVPHADQPEFVRQLLRCAVPGGLLILSTPDESGYPGGWSGYRPHVGVRDTAGLRELLMSATGVTPRIWRLDGGPFELGALRRLVEPVVNRLWSAAESLAPGAVTRARHAIAARAAAAHDLAADPRGHDVRAVEPDHGRGTGLIAVLQRPD